MCRAPGKRLAASVGMLQDREEREEHVDMQASKHGVAAIRSITIRLYNLGGVPI